MSDILIRLRKQVLWLEQRNLSGKLEREAADEIERLAFELHKAETRIGHLEADLKELEVGSEGGRLI